MDHCTVPQPPPRQGPGDPGEHRAPHLREGRDDYSDGRIDNRDDDIKIDWSVEGKDGGDRSYSW
jgi:hypothetical protein